MCIRDSSGTIGTNIGVAKDCSTVRIEVADDLRELIKANSRLIDMLHKRIEFLENKLANSWNIIYLVTGFIAVKLNDRR